MGFNEFPKIGANALNNVYGVVDPFVAGSGGSDGNGALNPLGSLWTIPSPSNGGNTLLATSAGYASNLTVRYVRYLSTANPAVVTGPAPVYYVDETFTTVSGVFTEGIISGAGSANSIAGFMLPNSGVVAGVGLGTTAFTAALLNSNYVFIAVEGFVPAAHVVAGTQSQLVMGAAGNWTTAVQTAGNRAAAAVWGAVTSSTADVLVVVGQY